MLCPIFKNGYQSKEWQGEVVFAVTCKRVTCTRMKGYKTANVLFQDMGGYHFLILTIAIISF